MKKIKNKSLIFVSSAILLLTFTLYINGFIKLSFLAFCISIILLTYKFGKTVESEECIKQKMKEFAFDINNIVKDNMLALVYPLSIIKTNGEILWNNTRFEKNFKSYESNTSNIVSIVRGIALDKIIKYKKGMIQRLKVNKKTYDIYVNTINISDENVIIVYFNDVTYLLEGTKESVMLIEVDNLSEVMKSMDESNSPLFVAEIERTINAYAQRLKAMIRKYDFSKYVLSLSDNDVEGEISRKFDILDIIRDINLGNKLEVTLSIGVGRGGNSPAENHADAIKAKELALGRGGDQAVIKKGNNFSFFGGNTKELEKRTRVRARVIAHALKDLIYESNKVYIMGHKNPDLDCFGAAIGLSSVVKQLGKPCNIVLNKDTKAIEYYLSKILKSEENKNLIINCDYAKEYIDDETLLVLVDVHSKSYVQDIDLVKKSIKTVIIDHHRKSPDFIQDTLLNYTEVYASSTSELVTEMVQYMLDKPKLTRMQAEGLLAGICMDTKNFFFKTGVRTFEAAAFLRKLGADTIDIKKFFSNDLESYRKKAEIIKTTELENEIAIATCPNDIIDTVTAAQAADQLLNIAGIEASFVLIRINTDVYISGRSLGDINVQVILEMLGGGGHMTIAGAKINNITLEDAKIKLKDEISKYLKEGE